MISELPLNMRPVVDHHLNVFSNLIKHWIPQVFPSFPKPSSVIRHIKLPKLKIQLFPLTWNRYLEGNETGDEATKQAVAQNPADHCRK